MGFTSFMTTDGNFSIPNIHSSRKSFTSFFMHDDKGNVYEETNYDGYAYFGGKNVFELVAEMNGKETIDEGIDLFFGEDKNIKMPNITSENWDWEWMDIPLELCENQGYFY